MPHFQHLLGVFFAVISFYKSEIRAKFASLAKDRCHNVVCTDFFFFQDIINLYFKKSYILYL